MFVYVDLETSGFDHNTDQIWEIGMLKVQGTRPIDIYQSLFSVTRPIPPHVLEQSHMDAEMLKAFSPFRDSKEEIRKFIGSSVIIAYCAQFEQRFLLANGVISQSQRVIDLYEWVKDMRLPTPNNKLQTILKYYGFPSTAPHRAMNDAFALYSLVCKLNWSSRLSSAYVTDDHQDTCGVEA